MTFEEVKPGQHFSTYVEGEVRWWWQKRHDNLGADLIDRHGCVQFLGGKRHIQPFKGTDVVEVPS
jgi:hypothetical protein